MLKLKFYNLEKSQLVVDIIGEKILDLESQFPELSDCHVHVSVSLENSSALFSSDLFILKLQIASGPFKGILISKEHFNFYEALKEWLVETVNILEQFESKEKYKNKNKKLSNLKNIKKVNRSSFLVK
jgi:hypothetical protein